ncbi:hypothetical protein GLV94_05130 [Virgibacillus halodenitrificans]|uniref:hypothetical protein n=1 Tax=Virgibacillus halodenitrificans TaxID=1482 RepID=UPI00136DD291|nr:hypothetical protein [Virgibacillus halodenitrificans]MYL45017.1 hypothetical protein [Virgibacillus halodenitrificans]
MKLENHFLPEDISDASKEYWAVLDLMAAIMRKINDGDIEIAKHFSIDLTKSLHELTKLSGKRYKQNRYQEIVNRMKDQGIHIEVVRGLMHEQ